MVCCFDLNNDEKSFSDEGWLNNDLKTNKTVNRHVWRRENLFFFFLTLVFFYSVSLYPYYCLMLLLWISHIHTKKNCLSNQMCDAVKVILARNFNAFLMFGNGQQHQRCEKMRIIENSIGRSCWIYIWTKPDKIDSQTIHIPLLYLYICMY